MIESKVILPSFRISLIFIYSRLALDTASKEARKASVTVPGEPVASVLYTDPTSVKTGGKDGKSQVQFWLCLL